MNKKNDSEKPKNEVKKRVERKRYLNVIYFIDSNRTRTLKFSIGTSYFTVGLITTAVLWSIVSATLLVRDRFVIAGMQDHTQSLLQLVFNYQTRYDEVYEKAYPDNDSAFNNAVAKADKADEKANAAAKTISNPVMSLSAKTANAIAREKIASQAATAANSATPASNNAATAEASSKDPPLSIDNFTTQANDSTLTVRLSLKNLNSPTKTAGSVKAVANFVDRDNKPYILESHPRASGDETRNDEHFNIRYFKNKAFYFEPPKGISAGRFVDLVVTIRDDEGRSKDFPYPLNKEFVARAERPKAVQKPVAVAPTIDTETSPTPETSPVEPESAPIVKATEPTDGTEATAAPTDSSN